MVENNDYFQFIFDWYSRTGLRRSSTFFYKLVSLYILFPVLLIFYFMVIFNLHYNHNDIFDFAEIFSSISAFGNLVMRKTLILKYGSLWEEIFEEHSLFWTYDLFGNDAGDQFRKIMDFSISIIKMFWGGGLVSTLVHLLTPYFDKTLLLPHPCWIPRNNFVLRVIIYALEGIFYTEVIFLIGVFDGFYLLMCSNLKIQFSLLSKAVHSVQLGTNPTKSHEEVCWKKLKEYSQYHKFLLRMHKKLNKIFSEFFVFQYFLTMGGTCLSLFVIFDKLTSSAQMAKNIIYIILLNSLLMITYIPAGEIEIEADTLTAEIYNLDWYNARDLKICKFVLFWLTQAQTPVQMTGAGIVKVNRPVMLQIHRIAYSVSTALTGLK
ncbi:hypothetical protein MTP99_009636 [Tenebrio molitor]|nr:hypothetical protein MTP99_009636 [Tenebrio molitor]